jgi:uncharacterized protein YbjQ (UPF0145 family)
MDMLITTSDTIPGRKIKQTLGLVRGNTVRTRGLGQNIVASLRNFVGGEVPEYTHMLAEARDQAIERMVQHAKKMGADAVVTMRFTTAEAMTGATEILAYGTAIKLGATSPARNRGKE